MPLFSSRHSRQSLKCCSQMSRAADNTAATCLECHIVMRSAKTLRYDTPMTSRHSYKVTQWTRVRRARLHARLPSASICNVLTCFLNFYKKRNKRFLHLRKPCSSHSNVEREENAVLHEITACLCPIRLTDDEKLSPLTFWKRNAMMCVRMSAF